MEMPGQTEGTVKQLLNSIVTKYKKVVFDGCSVRHFCHTRMHCQNNKKVNGKGAKLWQM